MRSHNLMAGDSRRLPLRISRRARWELEVAVARDMLAKLKEDYFLECESWTKGMTIHWTAKLEHLMKIEPPKE